MDDIGADESERRSDPILEADGHPARILRVMTGLAMALVVGGTVTAAIHGLVVYVFRLQTGQIFAEIVIAAAIYLLGLSLLSANPAGKPVTCRFGTAREPRITMYEIITGPKDTMF